MGLAEAQKATKKPRKKRVDHTKLGLEPGKLYQLTHGYRKLYSNIDCQHRQGVDKIRKGDVFLFLDSDLFVNNSVRSTYVFGTHEAKHLKTRDDIKIENWVPSLGQGSYGVKRWKVYYRPKYRTYSGKIFVSYMDHFGWLRVQNVPENMFEKTFKLVEPEESKE